MIEIYLATLLIGIGSIYQKSQSKKKASFIGAVSRPRVYKPTVMRLKLSLIALIKSAQGNHNTYHF